MFFWTKIKKAAAALTHIHNDTNENQVFVKVFALPVFDKSGEVVQIIECYQDITESKRVEEELRKAKEVTEKNYFELEATNQMLERAIERANMMAFDAEVASIAKSSSKISVDFCPNTKLY